MTNKAKKPRSKRQFFNKWCIYILEKCGYTVSPHFQYRGFFPHLLLLAVCLTMFYISIASLEIIPNYVLLFHTLCLVYKIYITFYNKTNCEMISKKQQAGTKKSKITSPYHKLFSAYIIVMIVLMLTFILTKIEIKSLDSNNWYTPVSSDNNNLVVYLSIIITCLQELFDGIVALYNASADIKKIG